MSGSVVSSCEGPYPLQRHSIDLQTQAAQHESIQEETRSQAAEPNSTCDRIGAAIDDIDAAVARLKGLAKKANENLAATIMGQNMSLKSLEEETIRWKLDMSIDNGYDYQVENNGQTHHRPHNERVPQAAKDAPALTPLYIKCCINAIVHQLSCIRAIIH